MNKTTYHGYKHRGAHDAGGDGGEHDSNDIERVRVAGLPLSRVCPNQDRPKDGQQQPHATRPQPLPGGREQEGHRGAPSHGTKAGPDRVTEKSTATTKEEERTTGRRGCLPADQRAANMPKIIWVGASTSASRARVSLLITNQNDVRMSIHAHHYTRRYLKYIHMIRYMHTHKYDAIFEIYILIYSYAFYALYTHHLTLYENTHER